MRFFVTGANGFIGKLLCTHLRVNNHEVYGIDIEAGEHVDFCNIVHDDISQFMPENVDAVIHLAALSRDQDCRNRLRATNEVNVLGTIRLSEAALKKGAKQFIFASTEWVYDNFEAQQEKDEDSVINLLQLDSEYAASKFIAESSLKQFSKSNNLPMTVLRFGIIYGPRTNNWSAVEALLNSVNSKEEVEVGSLKTGRCFIHVEDIISAIEASVGVPGFEVLNLQGDQFVSLGDVINASAKLLNKDIVVKESNPENPSIRRVSNKKIKRVLDWSPKYDIESGIASISDTVLGYNFCR